MLIVDIIIVLVFCAALYFIWKFLDKGSDDYKINRSVFSSPKNFLRWNINYLKAMPRIFVSIILLAALIMALNAITGHRNGIPDGGEAQDPGSRSQGPSG